LLLAVEEVAELIPQIILLAVEEVLVAIEQIMVAQNIR
jgi:hypothetical protein